MSQLDGNGNWYPTMPDPDAYDHIGTITVGSGAPNDANGANGDVFIDNDTGTVYYKSGDTWTASAGGSGAIEAYFIGTPGQDPNGVITATRPAIAYDSAGAIWIKTGAGATNTGWEQRL